jgi:hypothetical protein
MDLYYFADNFVGVYCTHNGLGNQHKGKIVKYFVLGKSTWWENHKIFRTRV